MGDTTHDDDRPSLAAKDRGRRVPTLPPCVTRSRERFGSVPSLDHQRVDEVNAVDAQRLALWPPDRRSRPNPTDGTSEA